MPTDAPSSVVMPAHSIVFADGTPMLLDALRRAPVQPAGHLTSYDSLPLGQDDLIHRLRRHHAAINNESIYDDEILAACPDLRFIQFLGSGASSFIDMEACARRGVEVGTVSGYGDRTVAEHSLALLFAAYRDLGAQHHAMRTGGWQGAPIGDLQGKRLGIVGLGGIGLELARLAGAIGMDVAAWSRSGSKVDGIAMVSLDHLLAQSDVVSIHLALNPATRGFMGAARMKQMKPGAVLINTARAAIVDENALIDLLGSGHLAGAGLDVFAIEPLPFDHRLRTNPKVTLTCHTGWQSPEAIARLMALAMETLNHGLSRLGQG